MIMGQLTSLIDIENTRRVMKDYPHTQFRLPNR